MWYKQLKKNKHISIEDVSENLESFTNIEEDVCNNDEKLRLYKRMQKLDEKSREIMYLRMVGNLNFMENEEILEKTPNWARVTFFRAKQKLKEVDENSKKVIIEKSKSVKEYNNEQSFLVSPGIQNSILLGNIVEAFFCSIVPVRDYLGESYIITNSGFSKMINRKKDLIVKKDENLDNSLKQGLEIVQEISVIAVDIGYDLVKFQMKLTIVKIIEKNDTRF